MALQSDFDFTEAVVEEFDALLIDSRSDGDLESLGKYPAKLHAKKVAAELLSEHGIDTGLVYLAGGPSRLYEDSDQPPPFRQRRYFYYLSGANFPDCAVTYDIAHDNLILWVPYVEPRQVLWYGSTPSPKECLSRLDVDDVRYTSAMDDYMNVTLQTNTCYVLHRDQTPTLLGGPPFMHLGSSSQAPIRFNVSKLLPAMDAARVVKTDYEVAMIRKANDVSSAAHRAVAKKLVGFQNEREVDALFRSECAVRGGKTMAYAVIAGAGTKAATLHYDANDQPLDGKQLLVLDAACEWDCYAADITRTLPLCPLTQESEEVYAVVEKMQKECIENIRPGVLYYKLHLHACAVALVGLMRLGILKGGSVGEIWNAGTVAAFFPHGLGHHVGLEVHDVPGRERLLLEESGDGREKLGMRLGKRGFVTPEGLGQLRPSADPRPYKGRQKLEKNMIVTVEPGIYFCREYIEGYFLTSPTHSRFIDADILERYYPVGGVRIEDDILVTEDGYENLTTAPKGEELMRIINGEEA